MRCWPFRCLLSLACAAVLAGLALFGPASARADSSRQSKPGGVVRRTAATGGPFASPIGPGSAGPSSPSNMALNPELQLRYHGGPVMHAHTIHLIFWAPPTFSFPAGYEAGVQAFLQDVAADSGKTSNAYGAITQYGDGGGAAQYNVTYGGSVTVNDALPPRDFSSCFDGATCITDDQLAAEVEAVRAAHSSPAWPRGLADQYVILTPPNVTTCVNDSGGACSDNFYCAYHYFRPLVSAPPNPLIYLHIPFEDPNFCHNDFSMTQPMPNGQSDVASDLISHEQREAATDPLLNAWYDDAGNEADDKCIDSYGVIIGVNGSSVGYNQAIGVGQYDTQTEWSNALHGCYQMGKPTISSISPGSAPGGNTVGITGTNFFAAYPSVPTVLFNGHASPSVTVDSPTHLTVTVPSGNVTGKITVQAVGGNVVSTQTFGLLPTIASLSASSGFAGQNITVTGTGFFGVTSVKFNGAAGAFSSVAADGTSLHVVVPSAATTGTVTVTTAGGTGASSTPFVVLPHVTSFTPAAAVGGANVTISGTGFSGLPTVDFTGSSGAFLVSHTATSLVVHVPLDATNGPLTVTTADGSSASVASFKPLMKITGFGAPNYQAGDTVTVNGSNFTANGALTAKLGALAVSAGSLTATSFQFTIPDASLTATVSATNGNGTANSPTTLKVRPTITGDPAPNEAKAGDHVVISGKTFTGTTSVKFNGTVAAPFTVGVGGTSLNVTVPNAAVDGPIAVTNAGGTTSTASPFKVDPKLVSFSPLAAAGGSNVTISGTGFGAAPVVQFTGSAGPATLGVHTATSIVAVVPADAHNGQITVSTANGDAVSVASFKPLMKITGFGAVNYQAGDTVTVNGRNFLATGSNPTAKLGTLAVTPSAVTDTSFQFTVPDASLTATVSATNTNGTANSPTTLKVRPTISGDPAPNEAKAGDHIVISGKTFLGTSSVKFNGTVAAPFTVGVGGTSLNVTVPNAAVDGPIAITNAGGATNTANPFKVDPKLVSFSPLAAAGGSNVTISGTGFGAAPVVHFSGASAPATLGVHTATSIVAVVPADAHNGQITVSTANGDAVSVASFKPLMKITGFGAVNYQAGDTVTVNGMNFLATGSNPTAKLGALVLTPGSVTDTSFQFTIPDNGLTATVSATNANGTANSPTTLKVRPTITGDPAPNEAKAGDHIVISGKTFTGTTSVKFGNNAQAAPFAIGAGGTSLNVTVPNNATSGKIGVSNAGGLAQTANDFTIDPRISSFSPTSGAVGLVVTVNGTGFGGADRVNFAGGVFGVPTNVTATSLKVAVPAAATSGPITVHTAAGTSAASIASFTVTFSVTSISPTFGDNGQVVTINGVGLTGVTAVKFNGIAGAIHAGGTATTLQVDVPAGAVTGHVTVWKGTASVQAPQDFTLLAVSSLAPTSGVPGTSITITGKGFTGATAVSFNGTSATFTVDSATKITARIPAGGTTGTVSVTVPAGTAASSGSVTVSDVTGILINEFSLGTTTSSDDDFVELYNGSSGDVDLTSCELRYKHDPDPDVVLFPTSATPVIVQSGHYYVIQPTADLDGANGGLKLTCGAIVNDRAGWGTAPAGFFEGTASSAPAADGSAARTPNAADTNDNSSDFTFDATPTPGESNVP